VNSKGGQLRPKRKWPPLHFAHANLPLRPRSLPLSLSLLCVTLKPDLLLVLLSSLTLPHPSICNLPTSLPVSLTSLKTREHPTHLSSGQRFAVRLTSSCTRLVILLLSCPISRQSAQPTPVQPQPRLRPTLLHVPSSPTIITIDFSCLDWGTSQPGILPCFIVNLTLPFTALNGFLLTSYRNQAEIDYNF